MPFFPTPDPVKVTPLDLGEIKQENVKNALYDQRLQDMAYESNSLRTLNDVLRSNPDATGQNVLAEMSARGFGKEGQSYNYNWLNQQRSSLQYETDLRKEVSNVIGSVTDEASKSRAIDYLQQAFPHASTQFEQFRAVPWQEARNQGNTFLLGGAGRVAKDRSDATGAAVGAPAGVDPQLWDSINRARSADQRAAAADGRAEAQNAREAELQPYRVDNIQSEIEARKARAAQPRVIMIPDPNDPLGMKKVPGHYDPETNSITPMQVAPQSDGMGGQQEQQAQPKKLDAATAKQYLQKAGGDVNKAREMARAEGWAF